LRISWLSRGEGWLVTCTTTGIYGLAIARAGTDVLEETSVDISEAPFLSEVVGSEVLLQNFDAKKITLLDGPGDLRVRVLPREYEFPTWMSAGDAIIALMQSANSVNTPPDYIILRQGGGIEIAKDYWGNHAPVVMEMPEKGADGGRVLKDLNEEEALERIEALGLAQNVDVKALYARERGE
jgi:hypothetical protein